MADILRMLSFLGDAYSFCYGVVNALLIRLEYPAATCAAFLVFELLRPRSRNSARSYLRGASFMGTAIVINTLVLTVAQLTTSSRSQDSPLSSLFALDFTPFTTAESLPLRILGWLGATLGIAIIADFFYYWMHRAQHTFGWMWRFHKVHHSITEMSATASYHHVAEDIFQYVGVTLPLTLLLGVSAGPVPWLLIVVVGAHTYFLHTSANYNIGALRYLLADNRLHRIHHSREERHMNRNFATRTPVWDMLFSTSYFPRTDEWPEVGLNDTPEPQTLRDYLLTPFRDERAESSTPADVTARF